LSDGLFTVTGRTPAGARLDRPSLEYDVAQELRRDWLAAGVRDVQVLYRSRGRGASIRPKEAAA
jgi:hypothetical protein